jgi:hypothetical protein
MTRVLPWLATGVTLGTLPYVVLKISWLAGGEMGLQDPALMQTTSPRARRCRSLAWPP